MKQFKTFTRWSFKSFYINWNIISSTNFQLKPDFFKNLVSNTRNRTHTYRHSCQLFTPLDQVVYIKGQSVYQRGICFPYMFYDANDLISIINHILDVNTDVLFSKNVGLKLKSGIFWLEILSWPRIWCFYFEIVYKKETKSILS